MWLLVTRIILLIGVVVTTAMSLGSSIPPPPPPHTPPLLVPPYLSTTTSQNTHKSHFRRQLSNTNNNNYPMTDHHSNDDISSTSTSSSHTSTTLSNKPCIPKPGYTALLIGQDYYSITNYTTAFNKYHPKPFGFMTYTTLKANNHMILSGLSKPIDYGSGIEWLQGLIHNYHGEISINVGLYLVDQCHYVYNGLYDVYIDELAMYFNSTMLQKTTIYLRIGYEFDLNTNHYPTQDYILAFQYIVKRFRQLSISNVAFVWHASGELPRQSLQITDWYPGREYIDLCGISIFQQPYTCQSMTQCHMEYIEHFASFCQSQQIPIMIAESTPFGGIVDESMLRKNPEATNRAGIHGNSWNNWFLPVLTLITRYNIRIWSYINCHWDSFPMWNNEVNHAPGIYWGDSRLEVHEDIRYQWEHEVLKSRHMLLSYHDVLLNRHEYCESEEEQQQHQIFPIPTNNDNDVPLKPLPPSDSSSDIRSKNHSNSTDNNTLPPKPITSNNDNYFFKEIRKLTHGFLTILETLIIIGFVLGCVVIFVQCLYKTCGERRRYRIVGSENRDEQGKLVEYTVIN